MVENTNHHLRGRVSPKPPPPLPAVILAKAGTHLAVGSCFRRNDGEWEESGFKPFCNTLRNLPWEVDPHLREDDRLVFSNIVPLTMLHDSLMSTMR